MDWRYKTELGNGDELELRLWRDVLATRIGPSSIFDRLLYYSSLANDMPTDKIGITYPDCVCGAGKMRFFCASRDATYSSWYYFKCPHFLQDDGYMEWFDVYVVKKGKKIRGHGDSSTNNNHLMDGHTILDASCRTTSMSFHSSPPDLSVRQTGFDESSITHTNEPKEVTYSPDRVSILYAVVFMLILFFCILQFVMGVMLGKIQLGSIECVSIVSSKLY